MLAWHCEPELKASAIERLKEHRRLDEIVQKIYWEGGRGCQLGCLTHVSEDTHTAASKMFGLPLRVCYLLEAVFEGLPTDRCADWVIDSTESIPVGADLSIAHHVFLAWLLRDSGLLCVTDDNRDPISRVTELHESVIDGEAVTLLQWEAARAAALLAAYAADYAASGSARSAAYAAARAATRTAAGSARAATQVAEDAASRAAAWIAISEKLREIFAAAEVKRCEDVDPQFYCDSAGKRVPAFV